MVKMVAAIAEAETETEAAIAGPSSSMKRTKKKGRPSLSDLKNRELQSSVETSNRRSTRRNPNFDPNSPSPDFIDDNGEDDDERKEKKVKLVVRLPQSNQQQQQQHLEYSSSAANSLSDSDDDDGEDDGDNHDASVKRMKIDLRSDDVVPDQTGEKISKARDTGHGSPLLSGPTTLLPEKKLLMFILDRLQKKDTGGVFSEPVDPNELPDYHEIIEHPMDFGTVRNKLDGGLYSNLEELEADVLLICSNAMQYNSSDTIYFRQARTIQDLAKRDFENLRHEGEDGEPQPKVVRRGRPPGKNIKKSVESSPIDRVGPDHSSGATLGSGEDKAIGSNSYNLRKGPMLHKFRSADASSEWLADWNEEFPASILKADMKYGKKHFSVDENRRDTYQQFNPSPSRSEPSLLWNNDGDRKHLIAVGVHLEQHAYARSLASFAANLGPVVWKVVSKKLESILPAGIKFGPGWLGEGGEPTKLSSIPTYNQKLSESLAADHHSSRPVTPSPPELGSAISCMPSNEIIEAVKRLNNQNELAVQGGGGFSQETTASTTPQAQHKSFLQPKNGFNGVVGYDLSAQMEPARLSMSKGHSGPQEALRPGQVLGTVPGRESSSFYPAPTNHVSSAENKLPESWATSHSGISLAQEGKNTEMCKEQSVRFSGDSWPVAPGHYRNRMSVPPDLNVKVQPPGSPSAGMQVGSSQQPDLALQL